MKLSLPDKPVTIFGDHEEKTVKQLLDCLLDERAVAGALCADGHLGYAMPIGGVIAYEDAVSPTGVGFDIGCGNMAARTNLNIFHLGVDESSSSDGHIVPEYHTLKNLMREIQKRVSFGMGRSREAQMDEQVLNLPLWANPVWVELDNHFGDDLWVKARAQLGTVGAGNHYVDLLCDQSGYIWVANHFGSRGLGHTIASGFMAAAAGRNFTERIPESEDPIVLSTKEYLGQLYIEAMKLAGEYAYAGREYVMAQVLSILGAEAVETVHNHHNFAWLEDDLWVVRKGATPLTREPAFIGGSMGDISVIAQGKRDSEVDEHPARQPVWDIGALGSAPHGAGRVMSRTAAAGKLRKMWYCNNRKCAFQPIRSTGNNTQFEKNRCPVCTLPLRKGRMRDASTAAIDWDAARASLQARGIVVLGAAADEAPGVYKDLGEVLAAHSNVEILHSLRPLGVVMAGADTRDPYKD